jgi:hypothetical protein
MHQHRIGRHRHRIGRYRHRTGRHRHRIGNPLYRKDSHLHRKTTNKSKKNPTHCKHRANLRRNREKKAATSKGSQELVTTKKPDTERGSLCKERGHLREKKRYLHKERRNLRESRQPVATKKHETDAAETSKLKSSREKTKRSLRERKESAAERKQGTVAAEAHVLKYSRVQTRRSRREREEPAAEGTERGNNREKTRRSPSKRREPAVEKKRRNRATEATEAPEPESTREKAGTQNGSASTGGRNVSTVKMSSQRAPRKDNGAEGSSLAPIILAKLFGEEEDIMEIDSPAQSFKKLLEEKAKNPNKGTAQGKRTREPIKGIVMESVLTHPMKFRIWLGFEVMEKLAKELGVEELFNDESIADRITRDIPRKEAEELESVSISYPRVPQTLYPERGVMA